MVLGGLWSGEEQFQAFCLRLALSLGCRAWGIDLHGFGLYIQGPGAVVVTYKFEGLRSILLVW